MALSMKRGETPRSKNKEAAQMADNMTVGQLREFAAKPVKKKR